MKKRNRDLSVIWYFITPMSVEEKRIHLLLKSVIYHYHGLDEAEQKDLDQISSELDAKEELSLGP
ncbi:MAG: hypothetical protein U5K54_16040 [Cytophagales bacterium]|nr:hypothetical protein [Cytophagales bacterium]